MSFSPTELALLSVADRLVSAHDTRCRRCRRGRYKRRGTPMGAPRKPLTDDERARISRLYGLGLSPWNVSKVLRINWRRLLREYPPTTKETA